MSKIRLRLIIGLGNYGPEYTLNRHNVGFMLLDHIAKVFNVNSYHRKFQGEFTIIKKPLNHRRKMENDNTNGDSTDGSNNENNVDPVSDQNDINKNDISVILFKPHTYMNNSGTAVAQIMRFYKLPVSSVVVIHDDLDLKFGKIKIKRGGGNGGHNGLRSLDSYVGNGYVRLRFGIGRPENRECVSEYVLSDFNVEELHIVMHIAGKIGLNIQNLISGQFDAFLNGLS